MEKAGSTNEVAKELLGEETDDFVVLAERQTAGKGRKDRSWESPPGNLYFSLCTEKEDLLPLKASVAVAKTLDGLDMEPELKWPNDVLVEERKICGILTEIAYERGIVGIGLNVESAPLSDSICIYDINRNEYSLDKLMKDIISNFYGIEDLLNTYKNYSSTIGERVKIRTQNGQIEGTVEDIDERGRLVLESGEKFVSGDVTHLRKG